MKYVIVLTLFATLVFATNDGCIETGGSVHPNVSSTYAVSVTLLNDWPQTEQVLGLDIFEVGSYLYVLGIDHYNNIIQVYSGTTGVPVGSMNLSARNEFCFGVAWNNNSLASTYYTNDWLNTVLYYTESFGASWTVLPNPAGNTARGMDFDGTDYWCTNGSGGGLWRFQPGVSQQNIAIPEVPGTPSGLTVFPFGDNLGVAVTCYLIPNIYFYQWDGSTMSYLGWFPCPVTNCTSYGLTYADTNGHMYWSYKNSGIYHLTELGFSIFPASLEHSSWGAIKSSF
ncbi:MAG: hypothetical protein K8S24_01795 [Candidatus Aegiribacteria sp.]|nr:hypothetical protein [Candidatus Aegiribacteria sp.]